MFLGVSCGIRSYSPLKKLESFYLSACRERRASELLGNEITALPHTSLVPVDGSGDITLTFQRYPLFSIAVVAL